MAIASYSPDNWGAKRLIAVYRGSERRRQSLMQDRHQAVPHAAGSTDPVLPGNSEVGCNGLPLAGFDPFEGPWFCG
jgi:hypothetical protein